MLSQKSKRRKWVGLTAICLLALLAGRSLVQAAAPTAHPVRIQDAPLPGSNSRVLTFLPGRDLAVVNKDSSQLLLCRLKDGAVTQTQILDKQATTEEGLWSSDDKRFLLIQDYNGQFTLWDTQTWRSRKLPFKGAYQAVFSPAGDQFLWAAEKPELVETATGKRTPMLPPGLNCGMPLALSGDRRLAYVDKAGNLCLWNTATQRMEHTLLAHTLPGSLIRFSFSHDSRLLAVTTGERTLALVDTHTGRVLRSCDMPVQTYHSNPIFSADDRTLAVPLHEGKIGLVDVARGTLRHTLELPSDYFLFTREPVASIVFAPDGKRLLSCSKIGDGIGLWEVESGRLLCETSDLVSIADVEFQPHGVRIFGIGATETQPTKSFLWTLRELRISY